MIENIQQTIKRAYDQYKPQDFSIGLDNLNPKREMILDKMAEIENKAQELTNEIIRKKIRTKKEPAATSVNAATGDESPTGENPVRKEKLTKVGGSLFGDIPKEIEVLIGAFPGSINELSKPPIVDCDPILQKYDFSTSYEVYQAEDYSDGGGTTYKISTESEADNEDTNDDDDSPVEDDDEDENDCAEIELTWLKLILMILKIIRILLIILDQVVTVVITIIQIVCLAVGAWLNPPNIAQIVQIILGIVIALVVKIIAYLIQALWSMLNLDCLADQTMEVLEQIQECMNAFKSTLGLLDPKSITFFGDLLANGLTDMKDIIQQLLEAKAEAWNEAKEEIKKTFEPDNLKKMADQIKDEAINAALNEVGNQSGGVITMSRDADGNVKVGGKAKAAVDSILGDAVDIQKEAKKKFDQTIEAAADAYKMIIKGEKTTSSNTAVKSALKDVSIQGLKLE